MILDTAALLALNGPAANVQLAVGAVVVRDGAILVLRRASGDYLAGKFEFPSGHAEAGELLQDALVRETFEETGLTITSTDRFLSCVFYRSGELLAAQLNFLVSVAAMEPIKLSAEHDEYRWLDAAKGSAMLDHPFRPHFASVSALLGFEPPSGV